MAIFDANALRAYWEKLLAGGSAPEPSRPGNDGSAGDPPSRGGDSPDRGGEAPSRPSSDGDWGGFEKEVIRLTNLERAKHDLPALKSNAELNRAADNHAEKMADKGFFSHYGRDGSKPWDRAEDVGYDSRGFGENIARGQRTPEEVVDAWMNSSGHRANILSSRFEDIGVGYEDNYWVQSFGTGDLDPYTSIA
jgi:uncharacterized protein YkwD